MNITTVVLCVLAILVLYLLYKKFQKTSTHPFFEMFDNTHPVIESLRMDLVKVHPRFATVKIIEGDQSYTLEKKKVLLVFITHFKINGIKKITTLNLLYKTFIIP